MIVPVIDVGGQYNHLISRMLIELGAKSRLISMNLTHKNLIGMGADGLVIGGGPQSIPRDIDRLGNLPIIIREIEIPILGICLAHQLIGIIFGGKVGPARHPEYGPVTVFVDDEDELLRGLSPSFTAWESHNDEIQEIPVTLKVLAHSENCKVEAIKHVSKPIYGVQFHPEVIHTEKGRLIFVNFIAVCK